MNETQSTAQNTLMRDGMRLAELGTSCGLLSVIGKYTHQRAPIPQGTRQSGHSLQWQTGMRTVYVLGMAKSHDEHQLGKSCADQMWT